MKRRVGVPIQEQEFVDAFLPELGQVIAPGAGRKLFVLQDVDVSMGRPDLIVLGCSPSALDWFSSQGLRLSSYAAARVLDPAVPQGASGLSESYERRLGLELAQSGWNTKSVKRASSIVASSVGIEAKLREIPRALRQVARFRSLFGRAAILAPVRSNDAIGASLFASYNIGLIQPTSNAWAWTVPSVPRRESVASRLWLLELLLREQARDGVYTPSRSRKASIALR